MIEAHTHSHGTETACAHEAAHAARAPEALAAAELFCSENGLRLTPIRREVLGALYGSHRPMSAYDVIDRIGAEGGKRPAPVMVYRALDFLLTEGFAHKLESRNAYIACPFHHRSGDLVVFMICERCGGVDEATSEPLTTALSTLATTHHFAPRARVIELQGLCAHCQDHVPHSQGHASHTHEDHADHE